jgi:acetyl-CoA carboxylase biotin carboxylase subunit
MRVVRDASEMARAYAGATAEAEASFKDGRVYIEKPIVAPRHVEVQVFGDEFGNLVHLGERDCSVQKPSHQKVIEETPAPNLAARARDALHDMALRAARYVEYSNAGTLEFLVAGDDVYFMEMNTRIQVEHPVTEMVYNIDLVKEQIRVAAGEPLGYGQTDLVARGHAIECRINAEDPQNHFAPAAGTVSKLVFPGGPGIRVDTHLYAGATIPPYYDSMIAKVVAFGDTRDIAIARMERALRETLIEGVTTTIDLCLEVLATREFRSGHYDIELLLKEPTRR